MKLLNETEQRRCLQQVAEASPELELRLGQADKFFLNLVAFALSRHEDDRYSNWNREARADADLAQRAFNRAFHGADQPRHEALANAAREAARNLQASALTPGGGDPAWECAREWVEVALEQAPAPARAARSVVESLAERSAQPPMAMSAQPIAAVA